jgi:hypothetical protein
MAYRVPLSSINASDGNVTYAQGSVIRVGAGGNVNAAGSMIIDQFGNVSINTSAVNYASNSRTVLTLNGATDSLLSFAAAGAAKGYVRTDGVNMVMQSDAGSLFLYTGVSSPVLFGTAAIERMRIDTSGRVGIGTATPSGNLTVMGNIWLSNNAAFIGGIRFPDGSFQTTAASGSSGNITVVSTTTNATFYPAFFEATSGSLAPRVDTGLTFNPSTDRLTTGAFIPSSATAPTDGMFLPATNALGFATNNTERMRINSGGDVGIGTSNPTSPLTVSGNVDIQGNIFVGNTNAGNFMKFETAVSTFYLQGSNAEIYMSSIAAEQPAPPSGNLLIYTKAIANRQMLKIKGPSGLDTPLQPLLAQNKVSMWNAAYGTTTVPGLWGFPAPTVATAPTARSPATTNILTRLRRIGYVSSSGSTGLMASWRIATAAFVLGGDANNYGGFNTIIRFGISDASLIAAARMFVGMSSATGAATNVDPATLTNSIGVGHNASDTNLYIYYGGSAAQTRINLGAGFPVAITTAYELVIFAPPNSNTSVGYKVTNLGTGAEAAGTLTAATAGTQLPANTTLLTLQIWRTNNSSTSAVAFDISSIYVETDY